MNADATFARTVFVRHYQQYSNAVCITRERGGKTQYRIAPYEPVREGDVPIGGFLSGWCTTEARAWNAAVSRRANRANSREHW